MTAQFYRNQLNHIEATKDRRYPALYRQAKEKAERLWLAFSALEMAEDKKPQQKEFRDKALDGCR